MAEFGDILHRRCPVQFEWKGIPIRLVYEPFHESVEYEIKGDDDWTLDTMTAFVVTVAKEWDLTDKGKPLPVTLENVSQLAPGLRMSMFIALRQDIINPQLPSVDIDPS